MSKKRFVFLFLAGIPSICMSGKSVEPVQLTDYVNP
jgi:hypothetical protein